MFFFLFFLGPDLLVLVSGRVMSLERSKHFLVRFNGKNYSAWAFQFQFFVKGKELWGHIDGTDPAPNSEKEKETCEMGGEGCLDYVLDPWKCGTLHTS